MNDEIFPLVDETGQIIGQATRYQSHDGSKLLHPVVHLNIFNSKGQLFLQRRSALKDIQPLKWDSSVGGHIDLGESPLNAVQREAQEEIGLSNLEILFIDKYIIETDIEKELTYCFYSITDQTPNINLVEIIEGRFWDIEEINNKLGHNYFTPNFEFDFKSYLKEGVHSLETKNIEICNLSL